MKKRMRRLVSLLAACALCVSCVQMSDVYASDEIISDAEVIQEGIDVTTVDEELVSANAIIQASKSSQDGEYVGGATTPLSGPANPRTPKVYHLDLNERNYPTQVHEWYGGDYMQGVGILFPGDKLVIHPESDPNPGGDGYHGNPGKILVEDGEWKNLSEGDKSGPLLVSKAESKGEIVPKNYVTEITVVDYPVIFNYSGNGNSGTSVYAVEYYADELHDISYWPAGSMIWVGMPRYHMIEYRYRNWTPYGMLGEIELINEPSLLVSTGANPTAIYAEDLTCVYNPIDGYNTVGPVFTIHHPQMKGYWFSEISAEFDGNEDHMFHPVLESMSEDRTSSTWRFYFSGADDYNWNFDNKKHGSEQDTIKINLNYYEAKTVTLNANGGTVDNKAEQVYTYKVRSGRRDSFSLLRDRFNLSSHTPVRAGYEFTGWYADKACTKLVSAAGSDQMQKDFEAYISANNLFEKEDDGNCAENFDMYAGWKKPGAADPTPTPKPVSGFSDVQNPKHPYYNAIYWAANAGITKGYPDGTFGINRDCTRGEMMMFLWRYAGKKEPKAVSKSPFKDVPKTHAFYKAILWGSQKGITKGYPDGTFGVNRNVTRGECMMFLWRLKGKPAPKAVAKAPFPDVPKNHVFYNAVLWGFQKKITTGFTMGELKGKFGVDANCSRGQIVTFLYRAR